MKAFRQLVFPSSTSLSLFLLALALAGIASTFAEEGEQAEGAFSMRVMDAHAIVGGGTVITGRIDSGTIAVGDTVCVTLNDKSTAGRKIEGIEEWSKRLESAHKGQSVGILVHGIDDADVKRNAHLHSDCEPEK